MGGGEAELSEGVVESELKVRGGGVAFELELEVGEVNGVDGETWQVR